MSLIDKAATNLKMFGVLLGLAVALGLSIGVGLSAQSVFADDDDPNTVHVCVNNNTGSTEILPSGAAPNCHPAEYLVDLTNAAGVAALEARVATLETTITTLQTNLAALSGQVPGCLSEANGDAVFSGCNVFVNNGEGSTATKDGTGNLIIGYNEENGSRDRSGSHNLVVGPQHSYSSWGGFVAGLGNRVSGPFSSVTGGSDNEASLIYSTVSGGGGNTASGPYSSVSGGEKNIASGSWSSVSGGQNNNANGWYSSIGGGQNLTTSSNYQFLP